MLTHLQVIIVALKKLLRSVAHCLRSIVLSEGLLTELRMHNMLYAPRVWIRTIVRRELLAHDASMRPFTHTRARYHCIAGVHEIVEQVGRD